MPYSVLTIQEAFFVRMQLHFDQEPPSSFIRPDLPDPRGASPVVRAPSYGSEEFFLHIQSKRIPKKENGFSCSDSNFLFLRIPGILQASLPSKYIMERGIKPPL